MMILQKTRLGSSFLEVSGIDREHSVQIEMIKSNTFTYLADVFFREVNCEPEMVVRLDDKILLSTGLAKRNINANDLKSIFTDLAACITEMDDYMLSADDLVIDKRYILFDTLKGHYCFLCVPGFSSSFAGQLREFMEDMMTVMDHSNPQEVIGIYDYFSGYIIREGFNPSVFVKSLASFGSGRGVPLLMAPEAAVEKDYGCFGEDRSGKMIPGEITNVICANEAAYNGMDDFSVYDSGNGFDTDKKFPGRPEEIKTQERHKNTVFDSILFYGFGAGLFAVSLILLIVFGRKSLKYTAFTAVIFLVCLLMKSLKHSEDERDEKDEIYKKSDERESYGRFEGKSYSMAGSVTSGSADGMACSVTSGSADGMAGSAASGRVDSMAGGRSGSVTNGRVGGRLDERIPEVEDIYSNISGNMYSDMSIETNDYFSSNTAGDGLRLVPVDVNIMRTAGQIELSREKKTIGRIDSLVDYCLPVKGISRIHAEIIREGDDYLINDLNSTNGTYVNSVRIHEPTKISCGDIVSISNVDYYCI